MTHFIVLIIIPKNVFEKGWGAVKNYIRKQLKPYDENLKVEPYVVITKHDLDIEFEEFKKTDNFQKLGCKDAQSYCRAWHGYTIDDNGHAISTYNQQCFWDWYVIGGRWDGFLSEDNSLDVKTYINKYEADKEKYNIRKIFDRNGRYHNGREYGWFGMYDEVVDIEDWGREFEDILIDGIGDYLVNVDCHI